LSTSDNDSFAGHIRASIDFLMRHEGRNINEIAWIGLVTEFEVIAPTHARATSDHVNHSLQLTMMVGAGFGVSLNDDGAGPQLTGSGSCVRDGGGPRHAGRLGRIRVELSSANDLYAIFSPVQSFFSAFRLLVRG